MRQLKFRVWNGGRFLGPVLPEEILQGYPRHHEYGWIGDLVFQQFTGRHDIKGVEIYECDILRRGAIFYTVEYSVEEAAYLMKLVSEPKHWIYLSDFDEVEVVGNIFENNTL